MNGIRYSLRTLGRSPGFTIVAIGVLSVAIAANLAVFSLIDSLFLKPLPVDNPDGLARISSVDHQGRTSTLPSLVLGGLRAESMFHGVCAFASQPLTTKIDGAFSNTPSLMFDSACFPTLGLRAQIGRPFTIAEDSRGAERVALLTDSLWRTAFAASPAVLGCTIEVEGLPVRIIGVTDRRFSGLRPGTRPGLILPLQQTPLDFVPNPNRPVYFWVDLLARRAPGVSLRQVQARLPVIQRQLLEQSVPLRYNDSQRRDFLARKIVALSGRRGVNAHLDERFGDPLWIVFGICGAVLLVGCVNLATLLLARGLRRRKEIAVRLALGAGRGAVARLVALDSLLLALAGSGLGLLLARFMLDFARTQAADLFAVDTFTALDTRTASFLVALVVAVAGILTAAPIWQSRRITLSSARGMLGAGTRGQKILLGVQVALTFALVSAAGLFTTSMRLLDQLNLGIRTTGVAEAMLAPAPGADRSAPRATYYRDLLRRTTELPGVSSAALSDFTPFWNPVRTSPVSLLDGAARGEVEAQAITVTGTFFSTLSIPILAGQSLPAPGQEPTEPVALVSQSLAALLGGPDLIGRHIRVGDSGPYQRLAVIGIAGNAQLGLENPSDTRPLAVYVNFWQFAEGRRPTLLASGAAFSDLRRIVESGGRDYIQRFTTLSAQKDQALIENRWLAVLSESFGALALLLAATGLFGLLSYHVAGRTAEIGLRMALGAQKRSIHFLVLRQVLPVLAVGIGSGLLLALALARLLAGLVFGVSVYDPRLAAVAALVLLLAAISAAVLPARRAASVDPLAALRQD